MGLQRIQDDYAAKGVQILRVSINERREKVAEFLEEHPANFPILLDPDTTICELYGIKYVPTTIVVGKDGMIRHVGGLLPEEDLRKQLDIILAKD